MNFPKLLNTILCLHHKFLDHVHMSWSLSRTITQLIMCSTDINLVHFPNQLHSTYLQKAIKFCTAKRQVDFFTLNSKSFSIKGVNYFNWVHSSQILQDQSTIFIPKISMKFISQLFLAVKNQILQMNSDIVKFILIKTFINQNLINPKFYLSIKCKVSKAFIFWIVSKTNHWTQ